MVEHVGAVNIDVYARTLAGLLEPGGRLLNHGITRLRHTDAEAGPFSERYVFPDAAPLHLSRNLLALERAGFVTHHVEGFASDYAETLRHWARRLDENLDEAVRLAGPERVRVWRLYLRAARNGFESGFTSIYQARCTLGQVDRDGQVGGFPPADAVYSGKPDSTVSSAQSAPASRELLDRVAAGRDADDPDAGAVAGLDVARGVADRDAGAVGRAAPPETSSPPRSSAVLVTSVRSRRVRAVAAEGEEAVEVAAGELDVGGRLDVAGDEAEQDALVDQPRQQLLDAGHHPVAARTRRRRRAGG